MVQNIDWQKRISFEHHWSKLFRSICGDQKSVDQKSCGVVFSESWSPEERTQNWALVWTLMHSWWQSLCSCVDMGRLTGEWVTMELIFLGAALLSRKCYDEWNWDAVWEQLARWQVICRLKSLELRLLLVFGGDWYVVETEVWLRFLKFDGWPNQCWSQRCFGWTNVECQTTDACLNWSRCSRSLDAK